jgi:uncharacterized repeat protein (TIGR01451 family)
MRSGLRIWGCLLLAAGLCGLTGCFGGSYNPSYFPWLCPPGDIIQTHPKPPGPGYYANFDPYAVRLEVHPISGVNPVGTQHVVLATVYDAQGKPRRSRRVEWSLAGKGNIIEVDESGHHPGRGYLDGPRRAVSFTNFGTHQLTRGNLDPKDDFVLRPGQTWCVVTSAEEGDTFLTAYAPGISDWDKRLTTVNIRWVDAGWVFPPPAQARAGTQHVFTTNVFRHTDKQPLANYRVRYRIVDGPPAVLLPSNTAEAFVVSDLKGNAQVAIAQKAPAPGINTVEVEIIRPPDPTQPSGSGVTVAKGMTTVEWLSPDVVLNHTGPLTAGVGQEIDYLIAVQNVGKIEAQAMTVTNPVPPGLQYLASDPPASVEGTTLTWTMGMLAPGQTHTIKTTFRAVKTGPVSNCAMVETVEGLKDTKCVTTDVTEPRLKVSLTGPNKGAVGEPLNFTITLENPGNGPAANVLLTAKLSQGLEPADLNPAEKGTRTITSQQGTLKPLEQRVIPLKLVPLEAGKQTVQVEASSNGLKAEAPVAVIDIVNPQLGVSLSGPKKRYVDRPAEWNITVTNPSDIVLGNVMVRYLLPPQLLFESATAGGVVNDKNEVVWDVGTLQPGQSKVLQVTTRAGKAPALVNNTVVATAEYNLQREATATMQIEGIPALRVEAIDTGDPVEVGKQVTYHVELTNTGSEAITQLEVIAKLPPELKRVGAVGPTAFTGTGQTVSFAKLPTLEPGKTLKYEIIASGEKPGDVRFRVDIVSPDLTTPVYEEESTTIIDPAALPVAPALNVPPIGAPGPLDPPAPGPGLTNNPAAPAANPDVTPVPIIGPGVVPPVPPPSFPSDAKPLPKG